MYSHKRMLALRALAVAAMLSGATGGAAVAMAQPAAPAGQQAQDGAHRHHHHLPGEHIEGRIAFLRAELKITSAQAPQFEKVATAMRQNAQAMRALAEQARAQRGGDGNSVDRLDTRVKFAEARLTALQSFRSAYAPLYQDLSPDQKKTADELLGHHHRHHR